MIKRYVVEPEPSAGPRNTHVCSIRLTYKGQCTAFGFIFTSDDPQGKIEGELRHLTDQIMEVMRG